MFLKPKILSIKVIDSILKLRRIYKQLIVVGYDVLSLILSFIISYLIINNFEITGFFQFNSFYSLSVLTFLIIFYIMNFYSSIFRFIDFNSLVKLIATFILYFIIIQILKILINLNINGELVYLHVFILFIFITLSRFGIVEIYRNFNSEKLVDNISIYGAGEAGFKISNIITDSKIIGFIDDNESLHGKVINQYKIFNPKELKKIINEHKVNKIIIAIPSLQQIDRKNIIDKLLDFNVSINIVPRLNDLIQKKSSLFDLESFRFEDLINRNVSWENEKIFLEFRNKNILITGAGGSIGSELSIQIIKKNPKNLYLLDNSENSLYNLGNILSKIQLIENINTNFHLKLIDITDYDNVSNLFSNTNINYVFHAAAYKHVPLLENNIFSAIHNNILGTSNILELSIKNKIKNFTLISSDKAVRPTNIMGVTKRFSEIICQIYFKKQNLNKTNISIVRFGNVLGSSGSVIPLFLKQLKEGISLTVTHPEVTRYFMTIEDAVGLVLQSSLMSNGGEIFVLNMGKPVKIDEIAKKLIKLFYGSDLENINTKIKYIGLRPGEKMHEELFFDKNIQKTDHKDISMTTDFLTNDEIENSENILKEIKEKKFTDNNPDLINKLNKVVKAFA